MAAAMDTETFKGGTAQVSFVGRIAPDRVESFDVSQSPALQAAKKEFIAIAESVPAEGSSGRFAALRASLASRKAISETLGAEAMGFEKTAQIIVDPSIAAAAQKFTGGAKLAMDHVDGHAPAPQTIPGGVKGSKVLS